MSVPCVGEAECADIIRCFADMVIDSYRDESATTLQKIHRHTYTFTVAAGPDGQTGDRASLLSGHIAKGDPVSISMEPDLLCLQRGFVTDLTSNLVTIGLTYKIDVEALLSRTQHRRSATFTSDMVRFRIDKDEMSSGMMRMRNNLAQLFYRDGDEKRCRLIVDLQKPFFEPARAPHPNEIPASLNVDQAKAMHQVLTARDYALVLGMPGTGKTSTIAEIIKALVARGKSVLLTSYTHSAVDTILMKLLGADFGVLRLGNVDKVSLAKEGNSQIPLISLFIRFTPLSGVSPSTPCRPRRVWPKWTTGSWTRLSLLRPVLLSISES